MVLLPDSGRLKPRINCKTCLKPRPYEGAKKRGEGQWECEVCYLKTELAIALKQEQIAHLKNCPQQ